MSDLLCADEPVDLAAVQADEAWLNFLTTAARSGDPLACALLAWSRDVESEEFPALVSTGEAAVVVAESRGAYRVRRVVASFRRLARRGR